MFCLKKPLADSECPLVPMMLYCHWGAQSVLMPTRKWSPTPPTPELLTQGRTDPCFHVVNMTYYFRLQQTFVFYHKEFESQFSALRWFWPGSLLLLSICFKIWYCCLSIIPNHCPQALLLSFYKYLFWVVFFKVPFEQHLYLWGQNQWPKWTMASVNAFTSLRLL